MASGIFSDIRVRAWDQLLRDPCAANMAAPCYAGTDSGYLMRTVDIFTPTSGAPTGVVGADATMDAVFQFTPYNCTPTLGTLYSAINSTGTLPAFSASGVNSLITTNTAVKRYRPVAACVKWIPTGAYAKRAGMVGMGYSPGMIYLSGETPTISQALRETQRTSPNGSTVHEVRWLPTNADENFTDVGSSSNSGAGTLILALRGIDALYYTTTGIQANGYFEMTVVWEWIPAAASGAAPAPKAPLPYTSQQVLSTIGDMGAYLFEGARSAGPGLLRAAGAVGVQYLTKGVSQMVTRGPGIPLLSM